MLLLNIKKQKDMIKDLESTIIETLIGFEEWLYDGDDHIQIED